MIKKYSTRLVIIIVIVFVAGFAWYLNDRSKQAKDQAEKTAQNFQECVALGNPVMESYPRKCTHLDQIFVENIGNTLEKVELIRLEEPQPNQVVTSPLELKGYAVSHWYFEGDFPVSITNWDGLIIGEGYATAQGDWMADGLIPFTATLEFTEADVYNRGTLILQKDNPSDDPSLDDALEIPVRFWEE